MHDVTDYDQHEIILHIILSSLSSASFVWEGNPGIFLYIIPRCCFSLIPLLSYYPLMWFRVQSFEKISPNKCFVLALAVRQVNLQVVFLDFDFVRVRMAKILVQILFAEGSKTGSSIFRHQRLKETELTKTCMSEV